MKHGHYRCESCDVTGFSIPPRCWNCGRFQLGIRPDLANWATVDSWLKFGLHKMKAPMTWNGKENKAL